MLVRVFAAFGLFGVLAFPIARKARAHREDEGAVERPDRVPNFIIVGDSRAHCGLAPRVMRPIMEARGLHVGDAFNYAIDGTDVLHHRSTVAELAADLANEKQDLGVVVWTPNPLSFDGSRISNRLELLHGSDLRSLATSGAPTELVFDLATMQFFPPYRERPAMKDWLDERGEGVGKRLLGVQSKAGLEVVREPKRRIYTSHPDGQISFRVIAEWEVRFPVRLATYKDSFKKLSQDDFHFAQARDLAKIVREHGGTLVILEMPSAPLYRQAFDDDPKQLTFRTRLEAIAKEEGAVFLSHADHYSDDRLFGDPGHLVETTADDYSAFLASELAQLPVVRKRLEK